MYMSAAQTERAPQPRAQSVPSIFRQNYLPFRAFSIFSSFVRACSFLPNICAGPWSWNWIQFQWTSSGETKNLSLQKIFLFRRDRDEFIRPAVPLFLPLHYWSQPLCRIWQCVIYDYGDQSVCTYLQRWQPHGNRQVLILCSWSHVHDLMYITLLLTLQKSYTKNL